MAADANKIVVNEGTMQNAINNYNNCMKAFENAYLQMSNAVRQADSTWHGQASETFKDKFNQMYNNISQTQNNVQEAVAELNRALETYAATEQRVVGMIDALNIGSNPWA